MRSDINAVPLVQVSLTEAATALTRAYQGYIVPVAFDAGALARRMQAEHVDPEASRLLLDQQGGLLGAMLIARRGRVSRLAALGVVEGQRGAGIGAFAVDLALREALARGDQRMVLEVISSNDAARRSYEKAGFREARLLCGYAHAGGGEAGAVQECAPDQVLPLLLAAYPDDPSWQTSPLCFAGATEPVQGFQGEHAAALVQRVGDGMRLQAFAVAPGERRKGVGRRFMAALMGRFPGTAWTISATLPETMAAGFLRATGWQRTAITQIEMVRKIDQTR